MNFDLDSVSAPNNILTDCLNGTLITFNGNEYTLQNDFGNAIVETTKLKEGFIPLGLSSYGGIIYVVSHNPLTGESEFGSFPSPERNIDPDNFTSSDPASGVTGLLEKVISNNSFYDTNNNLLQNIRKDLMNIDEFQLSSGDKYAVYITDKAQAANLLNNIDKLFDFKLANINEGSLSYIDEFNLYSKAEISFDESVSGLPLKYDVYSESATGKLAIIVKIKTIDSFNLTIRETTSVNNISRKTVLINATSSTSCDVKCKGFKLNIYKPSQSNQVIYTKYIYSETGEIVNSFFQLTGFEEDVEYLFEAIPFSQFQLYNSEEFIQFKKKQTIVIGRDNSGVPAGQTYFTDLFKYYIADDYVMIDFNLKLRTAGQIQRAYIELYDSWADISTIKELSSYNLYGSNTVRIEALSETLVEDDFGGIDNNNVSIHDNTGDVQVLLSKDRRYRKDGMIRLDHFYMIRICLVEANVVNDVKSLTYHDMYKTIFTDKSLNSSYNDSTVTNYDILPRTLAVPTYTLEESLTLLDSSVSPEYFGSITNNNDNIMMYNISTNENDIAEKDFGYKTLYVNRYKKNANYKCNINNTVIGRLNESVLSLSEFGLVDPTMNVEQTPIVSGNLYKAYVNSNRTSSFGYISSDSKVNLSVLNPSLELVVRGASSRMSYGKGTKKTQIKNGFQKYYIADKLSPSISNKRADIEFGGVVRYVGTGKYSGAAKLSSTQESEIVARRNMDPALHSDNFGINLYANVDFRAGVRDVDFTYTEYGGGDDWGVRWCSDTLGWPKYQSLVGKYINTTFGDPSMAYMTHDMRASSYFVNTQKFVYVFPTNEAYIIIPMYAKSMDELCKKISKFANSIFFATSQTSNCSVYYIAANEYSYDLPFETKFKFDTYGIECNLGTSPAFRFRYKNNNAFIIDDLSSSYVSGWLNTNIVRTGRNIVNSSFDNMFSTPAFSERTFNLPSSKIEFTLNPIIEKSIVEKFDTSKVDMDADKIWLDDPNIVDNQLNTSSKQYESILKYFDFDKTNQFVYYKGGRLWAWSQNCKYSNNDDWDRNRRRTIALASDLLTSNFEL